MLAVAADGDGGKLVVGRDVGAVVQSVEHQFVVSHHFNQRVIQSLAVNVVQHAAQGVQMHALAERTAAGAEIG